MRWIEEQLADKSDKDKSDGRLKKNRISTIYYSNQVMINHQ